MNAPTCPAPCETVTELTTGAYLYPNQPKLRDFSYWQCPRCRAYVGCHPGTQVAMGTPADAKLRSARASLHRVFDPLWRRDRGVSKHEQHGHIFPSRRSAYAWLARQMKLRDGDCHIGMFNLEQCEAALSHIIALVKK